MTAPSKTNPQGPSLDDLLARVEAATGPDRELNRTLYGALGFDLSPANHGLWDNHGNGYREPRDFLSSLDAALALKDRLLPGHAAAVGDMAFEGSQEPWGCVWNPGGFIIGNATAKTPALALLAALLKAVQAQSQGQFHDGASLEPRAPTKMDGDPK